ncbi:MAG: hypothetical protein NTY57_05695 [Solirubrobacterales bacterium]|jgi:hypothetical protein|nr:hypothetical protein [Solirubrobacterales bacterium]
MNNLPLFLAGVFITLLVTASIGLMVYAAVLDGRYENEQKDERASQNPS